MEISFDVTRAEAKTIALIVQRAYRMAKDHDRPFDSTECSMDLYATHANGCPLALDLLLTAPDFDFAHDIWGIRNHIDRKTGRMGDCFVPRFAACYHTPA